MIRFLWQGDRSGCTAPHTVPERMSNAFHRQTNFPRVREKLPVLGLEGEGDGSYPSQHVQLNNLLKHGLNHLFAFYLSFFSPTPLSFLHLVFTRAKTFQEKLQLRLASLSTQEPREHIAIPGCLSPWGKQPLNLENVHFSDPCLTPYPHPVSY